MPSIRRRLIAGILASLLVILAISGAALYEAARTVLYRDFDAALLAKARALAVLVHRESDGDYEFDFADEFMPEYDRKRGSEYFEIRLAGGAVLESSRSLKGRRLAPDQSVVPGSGPAFRTLRLPDGRLGRAVFFSFAPQGEDEEDGESRDHARAGGNVPIVTVVAARGLGEIQRLLHTLLAALAGIGLLLPLVAALTTGLVVRRGLRPLDRLAREAKAIDARNLDQRFPESGMPAELAPICRRLNDLLGRLQEAFARERRFTADVAHELRTPVAELRSLAEVALMDDAAGSEGGDRPAARRTLRDALDIALQMERLINTLLAIARCEAGSRAVSPRPLALEAAVQQAWKPVEPRARTRGLSLHCQLPAEAMISTDPEILQIILGNLLANAADYAPEGSPIECRAEWRGEQEGQKAGSGALTVTVSNPAPDLTEEDVGRLFEPFWRKDPARSDSAHAGLGLGLVAAAAGLVGATPAARLDPSGSLTLEMTFPDAMDGGGRS